jgi:hypothetical protein
LQASARRSAGCRRGIGTPASGSPLPPTPPGEDLKSRPLLEETNDSEDREKKADQADNAKGQRERPTCGTDGFP